MAAVPPVRAALVHDWLNQDGGAEAVLEVLHGLFPEAPVYTTMADRGRVPAIDGWDVRVSWMDRLPGVHERHQPYLPLYPVAWDAVRLRGYDLVLSNKSAFCHGVGNGGAVHVCYCLTPTRFVWDAATYISHEDVPPGTRMALWALLPWLRRWDRRAADRVDHFVSISSAVRERVARVYGRDSVVIHPPVRVPTAGNRAASDRQHGSAAVSMASDLARHASRREATDSVGKSAAAGYHIVLARLVPYKRIDLAVEAFNRLRRRLIVVGDGRDRPRLERLAGPTVTFVGRRPREEVDELLAGSRGLVWPGIEDFGLVPVEAMGFGRPVIARRAGGVLDTVVEGRTGVFFDRDTPDALARAVVDADSIAWDDATIRRHAARFSRQRFESELGTFLADVLGSGAREAVADGARPRASAVEPSEASDGRD